jgi:hypothetical protein
MAHESPNPAEIRPGPGDAANAACGAGTSKASPAASEITIAGTIRRRSSARADAVVPADMATVLSAGQHYYYQ